jgi:hypothetical protein
MTSSLPVRRLTDDVLWARVARQARCADSGLDPDQWYPVSIEPVRARHEAAAAIAVCIGCPVRAQCLELSLRQWDIGQHGVWGGLVATDRAHLRRRCSPRDRWSSLPALPAGGPASPHHLFGRKLWHLPPPGRRLAAGGTTEDHPGRRCGRSRLAGRPLGPADPGGGITGGHQRPVLAPRAGGL